MTNLSLLQELDPSADRRTEVIRRPIHYLGSKLRLADEIGRVVGRYARRPGALCDLFSGSGAASVALAAIGRVVAVDIQEYSRVLCSALLSPQSISEDDLRLLQGDDAEESRSLLMWATQPIRALEQATIDEAAHGRPEGLCDVLEFGSLRAAQLQGTAGYPKRVATALRSALRRLAKVPRNLGLLCLYYGGVYFSYEQAIDLDILLSRLALLRRKQRDTALAALLGAASDIVNTVGSQFAQPLRPREKDGRPKKGLWHRVASDRSASASHIAMEWLTRYRRLPRSSVVHMAVRADYATFLKTWNEDIAVFYADPPYTRDHYSRYYHVLETMCLQDWPEVSLSNLGDGKRLSRGMYRAARHQSPFCIMSEAPEAFRELFQLARRFEAPLILSYSPFDSKTRARPRVMEMNKIVQIARKSFGNVSVEPAGSVSHSKFNKSALNTQLWKKAEVFVVCLP